MGRDGFLDVYKGIHVYWDKPNGIHKYGYQFVIPVTVNIVDFVGSGSGIDGREAVFTKVKIDPKLLQHAIKRSQTKMDNVIKQCTK